MLIIAQYFTVILLSWNSKKAIPEITSKAKSSPVIIAQWKGVEENTKSKYHQYTRFQVSSQLKNSTMEAKILKVCHKA